MIQIVLLAAVTLASNLLVLRSGERIPLAAPPVAEAERVTFRAVDGRLFSLPLAEVDLVASASASASAPATEKSDGATAADVRVPLRVSAEERKRLIAELEGNHRGVASPQAPLPPPLAPPSASEVDAEWSWRNQARSMDEGVRRAQENLNLLREKVAALRAHITSLLGLGYRPVQFTYDSTQLQESLDAIPYAELDVKRAERARDDFRDEARRRGVLPGWLR